MVQRFRFIGITILSILLLTIVGAASFSPAYAIEPTITLNISPNPALPNQPVTFSGQVTPPLGASDSIAVEVFNPSSDCGVVDIGFVPLSVNLHPSNLAPASILPFSATANSAGSYSVTVTGGFAVGSYAARAIDASYVAVGVVSSCDPFNVTTVIPEYPFGLGVLAVFMIIGYGVIRRKTRYDYS